MAEKIEPGHYMLGQKEYSDRRKENLWVGVIKGETANESKKQPFQGFMDLSETKWYVFEEERLNVQYSPDPTSTGSYGRPVAELVKRFDTKSDAIHWAENRYNLQ